MLIRTRKIPVLIIAALAVALRLVHAQLMVYPELPLTLNGNLAVGYIHSSRTQFDLDSVNVGINGTLSGYYHHPNFLQFQFSPNYNFGKEASEADYITGGRGFTASANVFAGSSFPLMVNYSRIRTSAGLFGLVGYDAGLIGEGANQDLSLNWSLRLPRLPVIQLGYQRTGSEYTLTGANNSRSEGHGSGYTIGLQHTLLGFALTAAFTSQDLRQLLPNLFTGLATLPTATKQKNMQFGASRQLSSSTMLDFTASKSDWISDVTGYATDRKYTIVGAGVSSQPLPKLSTSARVHYISDLSAVRLASVLSGASGAGDIAAQLSVPARGETRIGYTTYSGTADYDIGHGLLFRTNARRGSGNTAGDFRSSDFTTDTRTSDFIANTMLSYSRPAFGGRLGGSYGFGFSDIRYAGRSGGLTRGHSGSLFVTKPTRFGWEGSAAAHFAQSDMNGIFTTKIRGYGGDVSATGRIVGDWKLNVAARLDKSEAIATTFYTNLQKSIRVAVSKSRINVSATKQFSSGMSILTATGLRPISMTDTVAVGESLNRILLPSRGSTLAVSGSYVASRRFMVNGTWLKLDHQTILPSGVGKSRTDQLEVLARYSTRLLTFRLGYRRYLQVLPGVAGPFGAQTVYFDVNREFRVF